jgi:hypothetical protein
MRTTTDRERDLAQAIHDAVADFIKDKEYTCEEVLNALIALVVDAIEHDDDPKEALESVRHALEANFPPEPTEH